MGSGSLEEQQVLVVQWLALEASYVAQEIMVVVEDPSVQEVEPRQQDTVNTKEDGEGGLTNQQEA